MMLITAEEYQEALEYIALAAIRATTEAAAALVDQCNREGPYNAIGAAALIRANHHLRGEQS